MHYKEQELQITCVKTFRAQFPAYSKLLFHPKNEEASGSRSRGAIHKAEGVVAGVADLLLLVPSENTPASEAFCIPQYYTALAIELKTATGRQSAEQKVFQRYAESAGIKYVIIRSLADFITATHDYMTHVPVVAHAQIMRTFNRINEEKIEKARQDFKKLVKKSQTPKK